jgi:sugar phosphate isomerase/epimerase
MSLRYGYVSNGLASHGLDQALELLADSGYTGIALTVDHVHFDPLAPDRTRRAAELRRALDRHGLDVVIETGARFALDAYRKHWPSLMDDERRLRIDWIRTAIDLAEELSSPVVSIWSGARPADVSPEVAWDRLARSCAELVEHSRLRGVRLGFEPEPGMLVERVGEVEGLADLLGRPDELGVTLDLGHCVCLEPDDVARCVERVAPTLVHVHADDMRRGVHEHLMFGEGELDLPAALAALERCSYDGMVAVELSRHAHEAHTAVPRALAALRRAEVREVALR